MILFLFAFTLLYAAIYKFILGMEDNAAGSLSARSGIALALITSPSSFIFSYSNKPLRTRMTNLGIALSTAAGSVMLWHFALRSLVLSGVSGSFMIITIFDVLISVQAFSLAFWPYLLIPVRTKGQEP